MPTLGKFNVTEAHLRNQGVMARLDRATQPARVCAPIESYDRLGGPLLRAMTR